MSQAPLSPHRPMSFSVRAVLFSLLASGALLAASLLPGPVVAHNADHKVANLEYRLQRLEQKLFDSQRQQQNSSQQLQRQNNQLSQISAKVAQLERTALLLRGAEQRPVIRKVARPEADVANRQQAEIEALWRQLDAIVEILGPSPLKGESPKRQ